MSMAIELLVWYEKNRRDLPWRRSRDPYSIWISEVMLQQTRVDVVLPYFEDFVARFPTVEALASASLEEVLSRWSGLGYYRRARQMHAAARIVAEQGVFPRSLATLRQLPGVGEYTAAAVGSIAFGLAVAVMDGNVERVVARLLALEGDPKRKENREILRAEAGRLLVQGSPGESNQAMMELGATVCIPKRPRCLVCPLVGGCEGSRRGEPERFPISADKRRTEEYRMVAVVVEEEGRVLLYRRPESASILAGTWEVPWVVLEDSNLEGAPLPEELLQRRYGSRWLLGEVVAYVKHSITHRNLSIGVCRGSLVGGSEPIEDLEAGWFDEGARAALPRSSVVGKILTASKIGRPARRSRSRQR